MTNFEKSDIYKKALKDYQDKIYGNILEPLHSIVIDGDEVFLFYAQNLVEDIFTTLKTIYDLDETDFPISLGYQEPEIRNIAFMGNNYKVISLWYDNCEVPDEFEAKI